MADQPKSQPTPEPGMIEKAIGFYKTLTGKGEIDQARGDYQQQERKSKGLNYFHEDDGK
jgi:hypothetical protein